MRRICGMLLMLYLLLPLLANAIDPLRLHVIANSDSPMDQRVKLAVRDQILAEHGEDFRVYKSKAAAWEAARREAEALRETADDALRAAGVSYRATVEVAEAAFPDKQYEGLVYPAGDYDAVRVVLGEGAGANWWCVMFPPLCLLSDEGAGEEVEYNSLLLEWLGQLFQWE